MYTVLHTPLPWYRLDTFPRLESIYAAVRTSHMSSHLEIARAHSATLHNGCLLHTCQHLESVRVHSNYAVKTRSPVCFENTTALCSFYILYISVIKTGMSRRAMTCSGTTRSCEAALEPSCRKLCGPQIQKDITCCRCTFRPGKNIEEIQTCFSSPKHENEGEAQFDHLQMREILTSAVLRFGRRWLPPSSSSRCGCGWLCLLWWSFSSLSSCHPWPLEIHVQDLF